MLPIPINQIITGDNAEVLRTFPDECIDLTVTSPPYDNLRDYDGYKFKFENLSQQLFRVTKQGGVLVWVVGDATVDGSKTGSSMVQALKFMGIGFNLHDEMIYLKNGPAYPSQNRYYQVWDKMYILSKGAPKTFNPLKDRINRWEGKKWSDKRTRRGKNGELKDSKWAPEQGSKFGVRFNVWKYNVGHGYSTKDKFAYNHPAIFPESLASDHIKSWSNEGDIVLDPFSGSGTTCKMAKLLSRKYIGVEISKKYNDIAEMRVGQMLAL